MVADNDPDVIELLVTDLSAEGHEVVGTAAQGDEALRLCEQHRPDVLVVDYRMPPGPNGVEVTRRLRDVAPDTAVVLYTNYRRADIKTEATELGAHVLLKGNIRALRRAVAGVKPPPPATR